MGTILSACMFQQGTNYFSHHNQIEYIPTNLYLCIYMLQVKFNVRIYKIIADIYKRS